MYGFSTEWLYRTLISAPGLILSLTVHEVAHARTALAFGDPTARDMGRTSFNPLRHLDPIGTIALFLAGFGWAKPVPVNPANLHPPRLGDVSVSLAGVASNLGLAVIFGLIARALWHFHARMDPRTWELLMDVVIYTAAINVTLCVFNLIPLYPLDGHHVVAQMVDPWRRPDFMRWQMQYGPILLMILIFGPRFFSGFLRIPDPAGWLIGHAQNVFWSLFMPGR